MMSGSTEHLNGLSGPKRERLEALLLEFDQSWQADALAEQLAAITNEEPAVQRVARLELVKIDLERQWQAGNQKQVEKYLAEFSVLGTADDVPVELLVAEIEARRAAGLDVTPADFLARFPNRAAELKPLLANIDPATHSAQPNGRKTTLVLSSFDTDGSSKDAPPKSVRLVDNVMYAVRAREPDKTP